MLWYIFFIVLSIVVTFLGWYLYCKFILKDDTIDVIIENPKRFMYTCLAMVLACTLVLSSTLYSNVKCWSKGIITKTETQYSWMMDQCQAKTINGSFVDMDRQRGLPDGDDHDAEN